MSRIYLKVVVWFLAIVLITGAALVWIANRDRDSTGVPRGAPFRRLYELELAAASRAYETGGAEGLRKHLDAIPGGEVYLLDQSGRDLRDGTDRHEMAEHADNRRFGPRGPVFFRGKVYGSLASADGRYRIFMRVGGPGRARPGFLPPFPAELWVLLSVGIFAALLAYRMTKPIRELQHSVERFGEGQLGLRVNSRRRDEIGQLARTFDRMAERIESLVTSQRRLLTDLSHELRTPLTRLGLAVELARSSGESERDGALDRIQREADRLNDLVGGLLQVTRGEAEASAVRIESLRLDEFLAEIVEDHRLEATEHGCRIELKTPGAVMADADPELLRRAVENVLRNAIRYSPSGEAISVDLTGDDKQATVSVRDRGPGAPAEALPHLFDAFYRADASRSGGGFGLGLSIAKRAVELHRGAIAAVNAAPGLEIRIRLPRVAS
ncbi:MAG: ATP-binding protein [Bryobacteraceae bacterium]